MADFTARQLAETIRDSLSPGATRDALDKLLGNSMRKPCPWCGGATTVDQPNHGFDAWERLCVSNDNRCMWHSQSYRTREEAEAGG